MIAMNKTRFNLFNHVYPGNQIGEEGLKALTKLLSNSSTLTDLNLAGKE